MEGLRERVERRVDHMGLVDSESKDSDTAFTPRHRLATAAQSSPGKSPLKSGKEAKLTSTVLFPQMWPHSFLCLTRAQREVKYEDLSIPKCVAGYAQILQQEISPIESTARLRHLASLMYFAQQFTWSAVLSFHGAVLLEIERGFLKCGDSSFHLESRTLYGHPLPAKAAVGKSAAAILFCRDYQQQACSHTQDHVGFIRGERKYVWHICAACWVSKCHQEQHREGSADCPLADQQGAEGHSPSPSHCLGSARVGGVAVDTRASDRDLRRHFVAPLSCLFLLFFIDTFETFSGSFVDSHLCVRSTGLPNYLGLRISVPSALHVPHWRECLLSRPHHL